MKSPVVKRSIVVAGHKTSVSLEEAFWNGMKEISGLRDMTLSELVGEIDSNRQQGNLSSAIRLFVLDYFRTRAMPAARRNAAAGLSRPRVDAASARNTASAINAECLRARGKCSSQRSINEAGAGRFFERGGQRAILLAAGAANRAIRLR
jgi:predicted DNA-binding ribbon-helix-helix protein